MTSPIVPAVPAARWKARQSGLDLAALTGSGPGGVVLLKDVELAAQRKAERRTKISPLALKLASGLGIAPESLATSSPSGRIMLEDVVRAAREIMEGASGAKYPLPPKSIPMDSMRKTIARRMAQSSQTAPHIHLFADIQMDRLEKIREELFPVIEQNAGVGLSVNDLLIKAVAMTLRDFPTLNATVKDEEIIIYQEINIGIAVALPNGLVVPAIPRVDQMGLAQIAKTRKDLVERARSGRLKLEEIERGTFTFSSLAKYGVVFFTAILNPPQSALLTVGATRDETFLDQNQLKKRRVARMGLSADHRIVDGAVGAEFLQALKGKLEEPSTFLFHLD